MRSQLPRSPSNRHPQPRRTQQPTRRSKKQLMKLWLAIGTGIALVGMLIHPRDFLSARIPQQVCTELINPNGKLSRDRLAQLLKLAERSQRIDVHRVLKQPYCQLAEITVRVGVNAQRDAYQLEFDPDTWLIVLYEGNEYAGYDFIVR